MDENHLSSEQKSSAPIAHLSSSVLNSTGDSTECEGIADDLVAMLEAGALEHKHEGRTARVEGDAVLVAGVVGDVLLALGDDAGLGVGDVVAVHPAGLHELNGSLLTSDGDRIGGLDITLDGGTGGAVLRQEFVRKRENSRKQV